MAIQRTRKDKENPHYGFLVSWQPKTSFQARVKREQDFDLKPEKLASRHAKRAESLAQEGLASNTKSSIIRSLILVSFILILELVVYLAWKRFLS